ncbi:hypothetical protein COL26b_002571 [Colletotrichum chrysophilum]|uniref:uncharacterized protein n=1 Tax=Colletotrichum chrysophilum TaxID=1836956 RepID=UPI0022FFE575|nr:uncharacterized protein COL26b_002571 [Colletotrichum chrysophilum]KAJ0379096.1 hypothetical protein COL26b_002571 [Colletotrichum chrysophilum]
MPAEEPNGAAAPAAATGDSPLLNLPYEIRLQIYGWVHAMHPIQHAQLAPWYPTPTYSSYFLKLVRPDAAEDPGVKRPTAAADGANDVDDDPRKKEARKAATADEEDKAMLSPHRPLCGLPSALLRTCRQIYEETRTLPFRNNEFVFVNWFSSGLWAARAFTRGLQRWQRDEMRYTRLEMLGRDFTGPALKEWVELCGCWAGGLRGLRLKILIGGGIFEPTASFASLNNNAEAQAMDISKFPEPRPEWIEEGLRRMGRLRELEVELCVLDWDDGQKIAWCESLETILNEGREGGEVRVRCVERLMEDRGPKREIVGEGEKQDGSWESLGAGKGYQKGVKMVGHVTRGLTFAQRSYECLEMDYTYAWPLPVRLFAVFFITALFASMHPDVNAFTKRVVWMGVHPFALLVGYITAAIVRGLLFIFIDGPEMLVNLITRHRNRDLDVLDNLDVENNTKLNAIMGRLHATAPEEWTPGGRVFDKKYKPFLPAEKMNFAGPRQKNAMTRKRNLSV